MKALLISLSLLLSFASFAAIYTPKSIYGSDNRYDTLEYPDSDWQRTARSVVGLTYSKYLIPINVDNVTFNLVTYSDYMKKSYNIPLCSNTKFKDQAVLSHCSGFLINKDTIVTAAHCVADQTDCEKINFVFDFYQGINTLNLSNQVYKCKKLLRRDYKYAWWKTADFAYIKLDRTVENREPLTVRWSGIPDKGREIVVIGHPSGIPQKIIDNGFIRSRSFYTLTADVDTFQGNSGSPVFNKDRVVEGIIYYGKADFEYLVENGNTCISEKKYSMGAKSAGEKILRINRMDGIHSLIENKF